MLLVVGGLIVGFVSGLFGGGGGIIIVPLLSAVGGLTERESHATSIAIVLPIAIVAMSVYLISGTRADVGITAMTTIGVVLGGLVGTFLLGRLKANTLRILFYLIMIVAGVKMLI